MVVSKFAFKTQLAPLHSDNQQVSLPTQYNSLNQDPVGALSSTFARLQSSKPLRELRGKAADKLRTAYDHESALDVVESTNRIHQSSHDTRLWFCTLPRESAKAITKQMPVPVQEVTAKVDEYARGMISGSGSTLFEELG